MKLTHIEKHTIVQSMMDRFTIKSGEAERIVQTMEEAL